MLLKSGIAQIILSRRAYKDRGKDISAAKLIENAAVRRRFLERENKAQTIPINAKHPKPKLHLPVKTENSQMLQSGAGMIIRIVAAKVAAPMTKGTRFKKPNLALCFDLFGQSFPFGVEFLNFIFRFRK